jgi:hypothetical protein
MKMVRSFVKVSVLLLTILSLASCNKDLSTSSDFLIKVDSIKVPDTVTSSIPFEIEFFGTISYNGCVSFKTFNTVMNNKDITIEAWATYQKNVITCPDVMVYLDGQKLNLTISFPGSYHIIIKGPGGAGISRQITVN